MLHKKKCETTFSKDDVLHHHQGCNVWNPINRGINYIPGINWCRILAINSISYLFFFQEPFSGFARNAFSSWNKASAIPPIVIRRPNQRVVGFVWPHKTVGKSREFKRGTLQGTITYPILSACKFLSRWFFFPLFPWLVGYGLVPWRVNPRKMGERAKSSYFSYMFPLNKSCA